MRLFIHPGVPGCGEGEALLHVREVMESQEMEPTGGTKQVNP